MKRFLLLVPLVVGCLGADQLRRRDYDVNYQLATSLCGHPDTAFQDGYNAGFSSARMHTEWSEMCVPASRAEAASAYQQGFMKGANNAPIRVVHTVTPIGRAATVSQCTFDSDCGGGGFHCRDHACMGYGYTGERCTFNEDCTSDHCFGGTCRE